ncbi:uncharacterized protein LOC100677975 [Nasonia vitripennis]|uniref:Tyr recombinase domain-containing protein n=1 Tax=Nasonia vitripennis TaxID=7425 RepID=A0A7M7Q0U8_NASVI|nr:uncharacterized protein LOC100677975 [Nasonia vitripennis]
MTLELPQEKRVKIREMIDILLKMERVKVKVIAKCIGVLVAACPAVAYGWLYYKHLELIKRNALRSNFKRMDKWITLSLEAKEELKWWQSQILIAKNKIRSSNFDLEIFSNASTTGWGAICGNKKANGFWNREEREIHINFLEIKAAFLALKCFAAHSLNKQILLRIDNITALAYINKMGGIKHKELHALTKVIWEWCIEREIWIFAEYIASKENIADEGSRITNVDTEWELANFAFQKIVKEFGYPSIDLFASRVNHKCKRYCSWDRDPDAQETNAPTGLGPYPGGRSVIRQSFKKKNLEETTIDIMTSSITESTTKQYNTSLQYWWNFCKDKEQDPYYAEEDIVINCLTKKFNEGAAYGTLNTLRSAISLINQHDNSNSSLINRFFKGVYKLRPTAPKYCSTWNVDDVLDMLETWSPLESLNLQNLTLKLVMLLALGSAFRVQSLALIKLNNIKKLPSGIEIRILDLIKTSKPGAAQPYAFFPFFTERTSLCIARTLLYYMQATKDIRGDTQELFISFKRPYKKICSQSISRWLKTVMREAGISEEFTAHSTRHASTSKAVNQGLDISIIKNAATWSEKSKVFSKFYNRPIKGNERNFAETVFS